MSPFFAFTAVMLAGLPIAAGAAPAPGLIPIAHFVAEDTEAGNPPDYMQVSAKGHGFYLPANKLKVYRKLEEFLAKFLGPPRPGQVAAGAAAPP